MNIVSNCPLCEQKSLHVIGEGEAQTQQCISCGYATTERFKGTRETNEVYKTLPEDMKRWSVEDTDRIWIPSMITLPFGTIYPIDIDGEMKWAVADMVSIPEEEQKNYPDDMGGFYKQRYDTDNQKLYDLFLDAMSEMNKKAKDLNMNDKPTLSTDNG